MKKLYYNYAKNSKETEAPTITINSFTVDQLSVPCVPNRFFSAFKSKCSLWKSDPSMKNPKQNVCFHWLPPLNKNHHQSIASGPLVEPPRPRGLPYTSKLPQNISPWSNQWVEGRLKNSTLEKAGRKPSKGTSCCLS